jgi:four helix bundle protein
MAVARKFEELICWQLADELKVRILRIIAKPSVSRDVDFCRQIRKASRAVPALIAEGFGRWGDREFARYLQLALGELAETRNHLRDGAQSGHVPIDEYRELWRLCYRVQRASSALLSVVRRRLQEAERAKKRGEPPP